MGMVRVFKETAQFALLSLFYLRDSGVGTSDLTSYFREGDRPQRNSGKDDRSLAQALSRALRGTTLTQNANLDEVVGHLKLALAKEQRQDSDGNLIDVVAELLHLAFPQNRVGNRQLRDLQRAILLPDEIGSLRASLENIETRCASCRRLLHDGELVTIMLEDNGRNILLHCTRCRKPTCIPCDNDCGETVAAPASIGNILKKPRVCPTCDPAKKKEPKVADAPAFRPEMTFQQQHIIDAMNLRGAARRDRANPPPAPTIQPIPPTNPFADEEDDGPA